MSFLIMIVSAECSDEMRTNLTGLIQGDNEAIEAIFACAAHQKVI